MQARFYRCSLLPILPFLGLALAFPDNAMAQEDHPYEPPTWVVDVGVAAANIVAGGFTAAATAMIRGENVSEAFLKGAGGGSVVFVGKRLAVERFSGAGLLGRQVAAVGSGMVTDAGHGRDFFTEVWLPVGPAWFQVRSEAGWRARVNVRDVGTLLWAASRPELRFDIDRSVSNGAAVFVADDHRLLLSSRRVAGLAFGGTILLGRSDTDVDVSQSHENVHVIQDDYGLLTMSRPLEQRAWSWLTEWDVPVDLNFLPVLAWPVLRHLEESEAEVLEFR